MTEQPSTTEPETTAPGGPTPQPDQPEQTEQPQAQGAGDDGGEALERSAAAIREAHDAEAPVAARDDITARDEDRAGEYSEDPDGSGGHP